MISRRAFLQIAGTVGGGLVVGITLPLTSCSLPAVSLLDPLLEIASDGRVIIYITGTEMGQGVLTSLALLLAEELDADWKRVETRMAPADADRFGTQVTTASLSIFNGWKTYRRAGALARQRLIHAAAEAWGVDPAACETREGHVVHTTNGRRADYGSLAERAALVASSGEPALKRPEAFGLVGKRHDRLDIASKVNGTARFGIDVRLPGMLTACVARSPRLGGRVASYDGAAARALPGVHAVLEIPSGIAVVADGFWPAKRGRDALLITWRDDPQSEVSSEELLESFGAELDRPGLVAAQRGHALAELAGNPTVVRADYTFPYLAHATMEPMNCTVHVTPGKCAVWAPTQAPNLARATAAEVAGLPLAAVSVTPTLVGGGFGRRAYQDFVREAVEIGMQVPHPVQVIWTREDDIRNDYYRPGSRHRLQGRVNRTGTLHAWHHRLVAPSVFQYYFSPRSRGVPEGLDFVSIAGAEDVPYSVDHLLVDGHTMATPIPVGIMRSIGHSYTVFARECFMDELAHASLQDPMEFRLRALQANPRAKHVLELAAERGGWSSPSSPGRFLGCALSTEDHGDGYVLYIAQVAEVSADAAGMPLVHRVVCVADVGYVVNLDQARAQLEGGIIFGLSMTLFGKVDVEHGSPRQSNFHDYRLVRMGEAPAIETHLVESSEPPSGIGEKAVPGVGPAVCNALFRATGHRIRSLPVVRST